MLRCQDGSLYTGVTTDVDRRFKEHKEGKVGAKYTKSRVAVSVVHIEPCKTRSEAQIREFQIKKLKREEKEALVKRKKLTKR